MDVYQFLDYAMFMSFMGLISGLFVSVLKDWWI